MFYDRQFKGAPYKTIKENTQWNCAITIYFKIHRKLGGKSISLTYNVFSMKRSTIGTQLTDRDYINTWLKLVKVIWYLQR